MGGEGLGGVGRGRGFGAVSIESFLETFRLAETVDREDVASREIRFSLICASMAALTAAVGESGSLRGEKAPAPSASSSTTETESSLSRSSTSAAEGRSIGASSGFVSSRVWSILEEREEEREGRLRSSLVSLERGRPDARGEPAGEGFDLLTGKVGRRPGIFSLCFFDRSWYGRKDGEVEGESGDGGEVEALVEGEICFLFLPLPLVGGEGLSGGLPLGLRKDPRVGLGDLGIVLVF